jgi:protocatechuate 3,4-dioxygenase beta subunit
VPNTGRWWRPPHIHFSVWGRSFLSRMVTQMFFPGEPLNGQDHILLSVASSDAREALIARALPTTEGPVDALVFEHRIVVRGRRATPSAH